MLEELSSDGSSDGEGMSLPQRSRGILYATQYIDLGVPRSRTSPLTELLEFVHRVLPQEGELGIEHRRHVPRVHEEAVTSRPSWCIWIEDEEL